MSKLRDKRNQLSDDQWENVLHSTLLQRRIRRPEASDLEKLEVFATLAGDQLSITFRNNISGITQKLGEVIFKKDESQELDITTWTGTAVERANGLDRELQGLTSQYDEQSKKMVKLNDQLEDLIKAKIQHEASLLQNFRELLNIKKLRVRDQQRLLAGAKIDPRQAAKLQNARSTSKPRAATAASRAGKRKAKSGLPAFESSEESGFEGKAPIQKLESDLSGQTTTPDQSDQGELENESGDHRNSAPQAAGLPKGSKAAGGARGIIEEEVHLDTPPPTRDLEFGEGGAREQTKRPVTTLTQEAGNEDEETDDDEL